MINIILNGEKYPLPTSFDEVPLGVYQEILKELSIEDKYDTASSRWTLIISKLTGVKEEFLDKISNKSFKKIINVLKFLYEDKEKHELNYIININGIEYGLDTLQNDTSAGEWIDLEEFTKDPKSINDNLHYIMAVLYRPIIRKKIIKKNTLKIKLINFIYKITKRFKFINLYKIILENNDFDYQIEEYDSKELEKRAKLFKDNFMTSDSFTPLFFFISLKMAFMIDSLKFFKETEGKLTTELMKAIGKLTQEKSLKKNGIGF